MNIKKLITVLQLIEQTNPDVEIVYKDVYNDGYCTRNVTVNEFIFRRINDEKWNLELDLENVEYK